jgi:predicted regulator of Ras-like GTPase activity (Roadblock/LC7/MglB family)
MYKLSINCTKISLIIGILGLIISSILLYIPLFSVKIPLILLIIGILLTYLVLNMLIFPKANTIQIIKISIYMLVSFILIASASTALMIIAGFSNSILNNKFIVNCSSLYIGSCAFFGLLFTFKLVNFEQIINPSKNLNLKQTLNVQPAPEIIKENKIITLPTDALIEPPAKAPEKPKLINSPEPTELIKETEQPIIPNYTNTPSANEENIPLHEAKKIFQKSDTKDLSAENSAFTDLFDQTPVELNEINQLDKLEEESGELGYTEDIFDADDIPDDIRLVSSQKKKNIETTGVISSIGKLLINNRDIEHIIETNELMQQIGCNNEEIDVVTMAMGIKIYDKFNKIMVEYTQVKDLTLSNKAGFMIASIIKDSRRAETIGAIASSAFVVLNNYLQRLELTNLKKVFFEAEDTIYTIFKVEDFVLFFASEKTFTPVNYGLLQEIIDQNNLMDQDMSVIKNIKGLIESVTTDKKGMLIGSLNSQNPKILASISSAIFENLKIFIANVEPVELKKITIFTDDKVLTIKKYEDKIAALISDDKGPIKLSDVIVEIEELMK